VRSRWRVCVAVNRNRITLIAYTDNGAVDKHNSSATTPYYNILSVSAVVTCDTEDHVDIDTSLETRVVLIIGERVYIILLLLLSL
jgi:hypothetical protein